VTIAAGFHCTDGIVICADSEQSDYVAKYQREKIFVLEDRLLFTGAGTSDYIKMAFDQLHDVFRAQWPEDPFAARAAIERLILSFHRRHIFRFFQPSDQSRPTVELIIATRCNNGELALVKTCETATTLGGFYESVGIGRPLFEYWAKLFYNPNLTIGLVSYLCALILGEVKQNVPGCGGASYILSLPEPADKIPSPTLISEQQALAGFPQSAVPLIVQCRDLRVSDQEFESQIQRFIMLLRATRQNERQLVNMAKIMKYKIPPPDAALGTEEASRLIQTVIQNLPPSPGSPES
jgi:hypothetical protein